MPARKFYHLPTPTPPPFAQLSLLCVCVCPAGKAGVNVSYSRGMDIVGEIHYDWPLESTLEVCMNDLGGAWLAVFVGEGQGGLGSQQGYAL